MILRCRACGEFFGRTEHSRHLGGVRDEIATNVFCLGCVHAGHRLTRDEIVAEIHADLEQGRSVEGIAAGYGCTIGAIYQTLHRAQKVA